MLPGWLWTLLGLPSYAMGVAALFWCFELAALTGYIKFWKLWGPRNDLEGVLRFLRAAFRYRALKLGSEQLHTGGKCMYLCNHRSWADFYIDMYIVGARAVPLSRLAVGAAFPAFTSSLLALRSILLFNRKSIRDTERFNSWLDSELASTHQPSLLVYPEGTRSLQQLSLPLKRGMLRYAYSRRLPVQAVITAHKEEVLNEKRMSAHFGRPVVTGFSEVLESSSFESFDDFMAAVQALWDDTWQRVHSAPRTGLPEHKPSFPTMNYSAATRTKQAAALLVWTPVLGALVLGLCRALAALAAGGVAGKALVAALVLWTLLSLAAATFLDPRPSRRSGAKRESASSGQEKKQE